MLSIKGPRQRPGLPVLSTEVMPVKDPEKVRILRIPDIAQS
jgi:hypothetical protein